MRTSPSVLAGLVLAACSNGDRIVSPGTGAESAAPAVVAMSAADASWFSTSQGAGYTRIEGEAAGALWAVIRPDSWNGDLVVLLHGSVPENAPVSLQPALHWWWTPVIEALVDRGFGVAFSSYRVNGFAVGEGAIDTRVAEAMFAARAGPPAVTYLAGWSMGTHVGEKLMEASPSRYAGFLSVCGGLGGTRIQHARFFNDRVLFDYFFPGILPGDVLTANLDFLTDVLPAAIRAVSSDPVAAIRLASVDQLYIRWTTPAELVIGVAASLFGPGSNSQDIQAKAHGVPFDNTNTVYTSALLSPADLQALNGGVQRITADPQALAYDDVNYNPDGTIGDTKILSLHTTRDPLVPADLHVPAYRQILGASGHLDQWVVRLVDGFGHCEFGFDATPDPFIDIEIAAFDDLVAWVRNGVKPSS